ncbi:hypothetical protein BKA61DRAFT_159962 [Leptodontidium sp. MPI-SDFR-AT-0119]|nr:hypothetical protein BKA61DRAFT_159962 [Leptodontidium sp. MPI-SDFR-AT-0119]
MSTDTPHSASPDPDPTVVTISTTQISSDGATPNAPESPRTESQQSHRDSISPASTAVNVENAVPDSQSAGTKHAVNSEPIQPQETPLPATLASLPVVPPHIARSKILWPKWLARTSSENPPIMTTQWGVHWYSPTCMPSLLVLGLFTMLGHHLFNDRLHGREVHDPQWPQRWGLALSTFGKVCLAGAVEIAYKQRLWITVKKRSFKIKTLNGIFSACYDPLEFLNVELVCNATIMTLLAGLIWVLPLCVIVSPATLTSISTIRNTSTICDNIQTIEFTHDNNANISAPIESSVVNDGRQGLAYIDLMPSNTSIAYYTSPSMNLQRISTLSLLSNFGPLQATNPCVGASNCSYQLSFKGPSYDCQEASLDNPNTIQAKSQLAPNGEAIYTSFSDVDEDEDGAPMNWQFVNSANESMLGTFTKEPSLWIGYVINTTAPVLPFNSSSTWPYILEPHVLQCVLLNVTYHYDITFLNGLMHIDHSSTTDQIPLLADGE